MRVQCACGQIGVPSMDHGMTNDCRDICRCAHHVCQFSVEQLVEDVDPLGYCSNCLQACFQDDEVT
jgi:hypothetical protein